MMLRLTLAVWFLFFPFLSKPSSRAGVGTGEHTATQAQLTTLRASWFYDWGANNGWPRDSFATEYVPMAFGKYNTGWEAREVEQWLATHPTSYVLLLNEPGEPYQGNMTCEEAGQSVELYANDIWADFPNARLIIGGILVGDYDGRSTSRGIAFAECMVASMDAGVYARITGFHWHFYPFYSSDPAVSKAAITELATWTHAQGKSFWLTEVGLIGWAAAWPDSVKEPWMREMVGWLDGEAPVDRWAWFIAECDPVWPCPQTLELLNADGSLTKYGQIYEGR